MLAGTYTISTSVYNGTASIFIGGGQITTITLGVNYNSQSTLKPTIASVEIRRALAHLLDKPSFIQNDSYLQGRATCNDIYASPAVGLGFGSCWPSHDGISSLPQSILDEDLAKHPWATAMGINHEVSAYNLQPDTIGASQYWWASLGASAGANVGYSGLADIRAACDHFVKAGFVVAGGANATDCGDVTLASQGTTVPSSYPHLNNNGKQLTFFIRNHEPRKHFGQIIFDSINFLFGTPNTSNGTATNPCRFLVGGIYCPIYYVASTVFGDGANPDGWNLYTGGEGLSSVPDIFYTQFHSQSASNICGGGFDSFPYNFMMHCDPAFDTQAAAGEFSGSLAESNSFFSDAAIAGHRTAMNIPVYSPIASYLALNGWSFQDTSTPTKSSLVNGVANGFLASSPGAYWSILNMRQKPGSQTVCTTSGVPSSCTNNPSYLPGGGNPSLIRDSLPDGGTDSLNPFQATVIWDFEIIDKIFDTLLQVNPLTSGGNSQVFDWMTTNHVSNFNPNERSCLPNGTCAIGTTTQLWHLRNDLSFHDGSRVTADDVVFSLIAARDVPSAIFQSNVANLASAVALDSSTVQVKLIHQSPFYTLDIGSVPILPKHIWGPLCTGTDGKIGGLNNLCANFTFDPMAAGAMVGSGPWECAVPAGFPNAGHIGGSCTTTHLPNCPQGQASCLTGQALVPGDQAFLTRYNNYARCCIDDTSSSLYKFSWADKNKDGIVSILDIADVAFHFGQPDTYWVNPIIAPDSTVSITDVATVAFYFGHGLFNNNQGLTSSTITGLDPCINPFFQSSPPC
jgi:hypothetical protein